MYTAYVWSFNELKTLSDAVRRNASDHDQDYDDDDTVLEITSMLVADILDPDVSDLDEWTTLRELTPDFVLYANEFLDCYSQWLDTIPHGTYPLVTAVPLDLQGYIVFVFKTP